MTTETFTKYMIEADREIADTTASAKLQALQCRLLFEILLKLQANDPLHGLGDLFNAKVQSEEQLRKSR
jgi:hypothetical protein